MNSIDAFRRPYSELLLGHDSLDPIVWDDMISNQAWPTIFRACWRKLGYPGRWHPDEFGIPPQIGNFQVIPLGLQLSAGDWATLVRKTRNACCLLEDRYAVKLHGNFLFFLDTLDDGECRWIFRFAVVDEVMMAVELLLVDNNPNFVQNNPDWTSVEISHRVRQLSELLPGMHFGNYCDAYAWGQIEADEVPSGSERDWFWRRPEDPYCYPPRRQPWYALNPHTSQYRLGSEMPEMVTLRLIDDQGNDLGAPRWTKGDIRLLYNDPNLCFRGSPYEFIFHHEDSQEQRESLQMFESGNWLFTVTFQEVDDGFVISHASVNRGYQNLTFHEAGPEEISREIHKFISNLIEKKIELYEKNRRQHRRIVPKLSWL
jgi:hypothetical protein